MSQPTPLSPRSAALDAILRVREEIEGPTIDPDTWERIVSIAWDNRTQDGDRREIQREIRAALLDSARTQRG